MEDGERDGEGWEQLLAKIPWRCGRYSLVGRRKKEEDGGEEEAPAPAAKVGALEKDAHFGGAVFAVS